MSAGHILTTGGFTKLTSVPQSDENNKNKVVLYRLENPTSEKVKRAKEAISQELGKRGWKYQGELGSFEQEIKHKNYLLKEGKTLQLIEGNEIGRKHQIRVSNTTSYLFQSLVTVGEGINVSGDNATISIDTINLPSIPQKSSLQPIIQCPVSHSDFVGRTAELERLKATYLIQRKPLDETVFCFLYGLGGVGKSELTIRFANIYKEEFSLIWFFPASNDLLLYQSYQEFAKRLKVPFTDQDGLGVLQKHVHQHLEETVARHPYLLIFDNVEKKIDPQNFPQRGGAILMTSREKELWRDKHSKIFIDKFQEEEAMVLLKEITEEEVTPQMKNLSKTLDRFPFLLNQVAHYIHAQGSTISEYLEYFDFKKEDEVSIDERYDKKFETVWNITFEKLQKESPLALEWLKVCAFLHPDSISIRWLEGWLQDKNRGNPPKEKIQILGALSRYALIRERQQGSEAISLHRLLQQALQSKVEDPQDFLLTVYRFIKKHSKDFDFKNGNHGWMPHGEKILEIIQEGKLMIEEIEQEMHLYLGGAYYCLGEYKKALEFHQKALAIAQSLGDQKNEGRAYGHIGIAYDSLGEYKKALEFHQKHLTIAKYSGDKRGEGIAYGNIGNAYHSLGDHQQALKFHRKDLTTAQNLDDKLSEGVAHCNIGNAYQSLGEYKKALEFHQKALAIAQSLGDKGGECGIYGNIGNAYQFLGEYKKALEYHEKHLAIAEKLGYQGGVGRAYSNIGSAYQSLREYKKALEYHKKDLVIAQRLEDQEGVGTSYGNIGKAYNSLGKYKKALEYHEKHLAIAQHLSDRGGKGIAYSNFGDTYQSLGEYKKALEFHQKHLEIAQQDMQGHKAEAYKGTGFAYEALEEYQQAKDSYKQALAIAQKIGYREVQEFVEQKLAKLNSKDSSEFQSNEKYKGLDEIL